MQVDVSPMDLSHTEPIYDFAWLQSKTGSEVMTVSSDGLVLWWDIRMFGEYTAKLAVDKSAEIIESLPLKEKGVEHLQVSATCITARLKGGLCGDCLFHSTFDLFSVASRSVHVRRCLLHLHMARVPDLMKLLWHGGIS